MPSANAGPITGAELIRGVQGGSEVWLTRSQFATWLQSADKPFPDPRPGVVPLPVTTDLALRAIQNGVRIRLFPGDLGAYTSGSGDTPVPDARKPDVIDGSIVISGSADGFFGMFSPSEVNASISISVPLNAVLNSSGGYVLNSSGGYVLGSAS